MVNKGTKRRTYKTKDVIFKGKKVNLQTTSYSVLASFVDKSGKTIMGIGEYPSNALKDLERRLRKSK